MKMSHYPAHATRHCALWLGLVATSALPGAAPAFEPPTVDAPPEDTRAHRALVEGKIAAYSESFPDILFAQLEGGERWHGEMIALITVLGPDAQPLDYQHLPRQRTELMELTLERLVVMLRTHIISATTFRLGDTTTSRRPYVCVITLNPARVVKNDIEATRYMLDITADTIKRVHPARFLDHEDHLGFAVDHEVFHCLESIYHGGAPMTDKELGGEYNLFSRESKADAFALAMHLRARGRVTAYARNITHVRALWLFSDSPNRCTFETLREILKLEPAKLTAMSPRDVMALAREVGERTIGSYEAYVERRVAALKAARILGLEPRLYGKIWPEVERQPSDTALVGFLVNRYRYYYDQLFTDSPVPLEAPQLSEALSR